MGFNRLNLQKIVYELKNNWGKHNNGVGDGDDAIWLQGASPATFNSLLFYMLIGSFINCFIFEYFILMLSSVCLCLELYKVVQKSFQ